MLEQMYLHQRQYSLQLRKESYETRREHLLTLQNIVEKHQDDICKALDQDFKKPRFEALMTEVYPLIHEIKFALKHLKSWMRPQSVPSPLLMFGSRSEIHLEPRGVSLLISPWNYPIYLTLAPLVSAIAAGNCVTVKPSEVSRHTSSLLAHLIEKYFKPEHIHVIQGGAETTQALLQFPFDHIFYTGSTRVGRIIMEAAAKHLTPVTLELGGKSPTIVDKSADLDVAAEKIAWAKCLNGGQTCVAPDYLFVQQDIHDKFAALLQGKIQKALGSSHGEVQSSPDFARMITRQQTERVSNLIKDAVTAGAQVIFGGEHNSDQHYIAPTLLTKVPPQAQILKEEIFGPVLPLIPYKEISEVVHYINERPKPLALYMYSNSKLYIDKIIQETSSGGVVINDSIIHLANSHLPFGGVGESGMGRSHGLHGFRSFSNEKAVLRQGPFGKFMRATYPPYTEAKIKLIQKLIQWKI